MNGLIIQRIIVNDTNTDTVQLPIAFTTKNYFAIGVIYNSGVSMTNNAYEAQIFPSVYEQQTIRFGATTSVKRRVFAIGY